VPKCWIVSFLGTQICHLGSLGTPFLHPGDIFVRCWAPHLKGTSIEVGLLPQAGHSGVHIEIYMDLGWILGVHWDLLWCHLSDILRICDTKVTVWVTGWICCCFWWYIGEAKVKKSMVFTVRDTHYPLW
jgi:hypothetical protein